MFWFSYPLNSVLHWLIAHLLAMDMMDRLDEVCVAPKCHAARHASPSHTPGIPVREQGGCNRCYRFTHGTDYDLDHLDRYIVHFPFETTQVAGPPPLHNVSFKKTLVETLNNVGHPTRCPQPLNSVRLMVSYIVQRLHNYFFKPTLCRGGGPGRVSRLCKSRIVQIPAPTCARAVAYRSDL